MYILVFNFMSEDKAYCRKCGVEIFSEAEICPHCGVRQFEVKPCKDRVIAVILAIFLGGLGAHKFYMGHTMMGFIYLLFSWTFIPTMISLIEALIYILDSDESFQQKIG
jgi:TM2 domain-containing membrane protein YozV